MNKIFTGPAGNVPVMAAPLVAATDMGCGYLVERQTDATKYTLSAQAASVQEAETLITVDTGATSGITTDNAASYKAGATVEPLEAKSGDYVNVRFAKINVTKKGLAVTSAGSGGLFTLATAGQKIHGYTNEIKNVANAGDLLAIRIK